MVFRESGIRPIFNRQFASMNLRQTLLAEQTIKNRDLIVNWIGKNPDRFGQLMELFFEGEYRITQRAAWPMSYCVQKNPGLIRPYLKKLIHNLQNSGLPDAILRNTLRLLQELKIPGNLQGALMNHCFRYVQSPDTAAAIKAFALTVLDNLCQDHPAIFPELKLTIEERWPYEKASFHSRARRILKKHAREKDAFSSF